MKLQVWGKEYDVVALEFFRDTGEFSDAVLSWEGVQCAAQSGEYILVAVDGDGHMTREDIQKMIDYEEALRADCFGDEVWNG